MIAMLTGAHILVCINVSLVMPSHYFTKIVKYVREDLTFVLISFFSCLVEFSTRKWPCSRTRARTLMQRYIRNTYVSLVGKYVGSRAATEFLRYMALPLGRLILLSASRLHTGRPLRTFNGRTLKAFSSFFSFFVLTLQRSSGGGNLNTRAERVFSI